MIPKLIAGASKLTMNFVAIHVIIISLLVNHVGNSFQLPVKHGLYSYNFNRRFFKFARHIYCVYAKRIQFILTKVSSVTDPGSALRISVIACIASSGDECISS